MKKEFIIIFVLVLFAGCFIVLHYRYDNRAAFSFKDNRSPAVKTPDCPVAEQKKSACVAGAEDYKKLKQEIVSDFTGKVPREWGQKVTGVKTRLVTDKKAIALTFDADSGNYDSGLIDYLKKEKVPATLFITGKWIDEHPDIFQELSENRLFEIENHGSNHKPCSANGKSAYQIKGTSDASDIFYEIEQNARKIETLTGRKPEFYRPGTAFLDEVCVQIAGKLGYKVISAYLKILWYNL